MVCAAFKPDTFFDISSRIGLFHAIRARVWWDAGGRGVPREEESRAEQMQRCGIPDTNRPAT